MRRIGDGARSLLLLMVTAAQLFTPALPALGLGRDIAARSAEAPTLITPPGWAFGIWGPIYAGLFAFAIWSTRSRNRTRPLIRRVGPPAIVGIALNALWPLVFQIGGMSGWSVLVIVAEAIAFAVAARIAARPLLSARDPDQYLVALPIGAITGWVLAASIVNVSGWLGNVAHVPLPAFAPEMWVAIAAGFGAVLASAVIVSTGNGWPALTFIWGLAGIAARQQAVGNRPGMVVAVAGAVLAAILAIRTARRRA